MGAVCMALWVQRVTGKRRGKTNKQQYYTHGKNWWYIQVTISGSNQNGDTIIVRKLRLTCIEMARSSQG